MPTLHIVKGLPQDLPTELGRRKTLHEDEKRTRERRKVQAAREFELAHFEQGKFFQQEAERLLGKDLKVHDKVGGALPKAAAPAGEAPIVLSHLIALERSWSRLPTDGIWASLTIDREAVCGTLRRAIAALAEAAPSTQQQLSTP